VVDGAAGEVGVERLEFGAIADVEDAGAIAGGDGRIPPPAAGGCKQGQRESE
jgi:hypothetical protein